MRNDKYFGQFRCTITVYNSICLRHHKNKLEKSMTEGKSIHTLPTIDGIRIQKNNLQTNGWNGNGIKTSSSISKHFYGMV